MLFFFFNGHHYINRCKSCSEFTTVIPLPHPPHTHVQYFCWNFLNNYCTSVLLDCSVLVPSYVPTLQYKHAASDDTNADILQTSNRWPIVAAGTATPRISLAMLAGRQKNQRWPFYLSLDLRLHEN